MLLFGLISMNSSFKVTTCYFYLLCFKYELNRNCCIGKQNWYGIGLVKGLLVKKYFAVSSKILSSQSAFAFWATTAIFWNQFVVSQELLSFDVFVQFSFVELLKKLFEFILLIIQDCYNKKIKVRLHLKQITLAIFLYLMLLLFLRSNLFFLYLPYNKVCMYNLIFCYLK